MEKSNSKPRRTYKKCEDRYKYDVVVANAEDFKLADWQARMIARCIVRGWDKIMRDFYGKPENERAFREWCFETYGYYPEPLDQ